MVLALWQTYKDEAVVNAKEASEQAKDTAKVRFDPLPRLHKWGPVR
jgi:hypothetical protein